ncbi:MAG TPA: hypothetical protein VEM93_00640, partial [Actinomycetota bacterium]|nr:hypothetical protein [Actinomycetota bacterium]
MDGGSLRVVPGRAGPGRFSSASLHVAQRLKDDPHLQLRTLLGDRLRQRLEREEPVLVEAFPTARLDRDSNTVTLLNHRLPPGWSHETTDVLFGFPSNYPAGCPDNVCVRPDLRLASRELPANNQGIQTHAGREWL